jgi:pimeloyl-ACP methyl ester carboxylesterase
VTRVRSVPRQYGPAMGDSSIMDLPDGRELAWIDLGKRRAPVVFAFHGTPGSRRTLTFDARAIVASGVRVVAPDRPGYGHSTARPGSGFADWAADVASLADHLKIGRFAVFGASGGGPFALACGRYLADRVAAIGIASGLGPTAEPGTEAGMTGVNRALVRLARRSALLAYPVLALGDQIFRWWPERALEGATRQLPPSDVEIMRRPEVQAVLAGDRSPAPHLVSLTAAREFALFAHDWGFRPEDVTVPVTLWHGLDDRNVPVAHARNLAEQLAKAELHEYPGEGHLLFFDRLADMLRVLGDAVTGDGPGRQSGLDPQ